MDAEDRYVTIEMLAQRCDEREEGDGNRHTPGVDGWGRSRSDRAAWRAFQSGFIVALFVAAQIASAADPVPLAPATPGLSPLLACTEPTKDQAGNPLGIQRGPDRNGLLGCYASLTSAGKTIWESWLKPDSEGGGKRHELGAFLPKDVSAYPVDVGCVCFGRVGWGFPARGRVGLALYDVAPK